MPRSGSRVRVSFSAQNKAAAFRLLLLFCYETSNEATPVPRGDRRANGEGVTLSPRRPKAGPRQRARVSFSAQNKTPALLVGVFVLIRDLELSDPRPSHKLAVNALIFNTLAYSNRSIFERLLYNNRLIINYIAASCGCDAIVTVNLLILNAFLYNPRSKTERGLCSNALVIRYIAASGCGMEPALRVQSRDLRG